MGVHDISFLKVGGHYPDTAAVLMDEAFAKAKTVDGETPFETIKIRSKADLNQVERTIPVIFPSLQGRELGFSVLREKDDQVVVQGFTRAAGKGPYAWAQDFVATPAGVEAWLTHVEKSGNVEAAGELRRARDAMAAHIK